MKCLSILASLLVVVLSISFVFASDVKPKTVLVTGASSGIGLRITEILSENGYLVYAGARKESDLKRLDGMKNVEAIKLDVTVQEDIDTAVKYVINQGRGLYGLVNNAGITMTGPLIEIPVSELEWLFNVNVYGPYRITQAFAPLLIESKGRIITTGSITGIFSGAFNGHYSMSKHAMEAFTDSLALEMERFGVKVSVIEPGHYASNSGKTAVKRLKEKAYWTEDSVYSEELKFMQTMNERLNSSEAPEAGILKFQLPSNGAFQRESSWRPPPRLCLKPHNRRVMA